MTDRPIIFSAPMVRALLDGTKTQTRRVLKFAGRAPEFCGGVGDKDDPTCWGWEDSEHGDWVTLERDADQRMGWRDWRGAYQIGDRLWVRESWNVFSGSQDGETVWPLESIPTREEFDAVSDEACRGTWQIFHTESDHARQWLSDQKWRPSIHMPRWASRLTLIVTDVRVQRLKDISDNDALAEGVNRTNTSIYGYATKRFERLWNSINGPDAWEANPWVVAVSFEVHQSNIDQLEIAQEAA